MRQKHISLESLRERGDQRIVLCGHMQHILRQVNAEKLLMLRCAEQKCTDIRSSVLGHKPAVILSALIGQEQIDSLGELGGLG